MKKIISAVAFSTTILAASHMASAGPLNSPKPAKAKNVILMISDGQGFNQMRVANYYTGTTPVYETFGHKFAMQTNSANNPAGYDPVAMATNFSYAKSGATDSASAATAMYTGIKIYDGQINMTTDGHPIITYFEMAAEAGKSIGAVSSVQVSHATPAAVYGHNKSRNNYAELGNEGIYGSNPLDNNGLYDSLNYFENLKVLMGAGHPNYTNDNVYNAGVSDNYVGGSITAVDVWDGTPPNGWTLIDSKEDFEAVANGSLQPEKLLGIAQVNSTLQQSRTDLEGDFDTPNANVPTLETMTRAALNVLDDNSEGFAVMIEGGAVDWAGHANQLDRIIEEQIDFNDAVQAVVEYLDNNTNGNNWSNTLLIVTADHETGHLWGDGSGTYVDVNGNSIFDMNIDYAHVTDNGVGNLPGAAFHSGSHTNVLVPLYTKGANSESFVSCVIGRDKNLKAIYDLDDTWSSRYIDNTCVYEVMKRASLAEMD